ncbi:hypothetical protein I9W82_005449 [Candida metapsilosis]|uniref:Uncharacterized protein n=1 Tax=Candida metapsilosis TaxID=273372 RepID=A0A8H7ZF39_9ASCO|nr:hypothetical protein I9W82_005449 [Candida metapsilosis]
MPIELSQPPTELPQPSTEIWIGDITDNREALRLFKKEPASIVVYDFDFDSNARYLFYILFREERPHWTLLIRDGIFIAYHIVLTGGEFTRIDYPGYSIIRDKEVLSKLL